MAVYGSTIRNTEYENTVNQAKLHLESNKDRNQLRMNLFTPLSVSKEGGEGVLRLGKTWNSCALGEIVTLCQETYMLQSCSTLTRLNYSESQQREWGPSCSWLQLMWSAQIWLDMAASLQRPSNHNQTNAHLSLDGQAVTILSNTYNHVHMGTGLQVCV